MFNIRRFAMLLVLAALAPGCRDQEGAQPPGSPPKAPAKAPAHDRRLFVVGLDAADERLVSQGIAAGRLPNFDRMIREGCSGPLRTHRPILSPILWTTMATGLTPDRHGVLDFVEQEASGRVVPITSRSRRAPAFWEILGAAGFKCGIVGWLATFPVRPLNGFVISDRFTLHPFGDGVEPPNTDRSGTTYPPGLDERLRETLVSPAAITDAELASTFGAPTVPAGEDAPQRRELRVIEAAARTYTAAALRLDEREKPDLLAVYFEAIDRLMHLFGAAMAPPLPGTAKGMADRYGHAVERFYAAMDRRLGEFMTEAGEEGTVLVISDHGFKIGDERPQHPALRSDVFAAEWHRDPGIVVAWGRGVLRGAKIQDADIYDVTPTLLAYFGVPASESMRGHVLVGLFEPGFLPPLGPRVHDYPMAEPAGRPGSDAAPTAGTAPSGAGSPAGRAEEATILENLRALGYVGGGGSKTEDRSSANLATFYLEEKQFDRAIEIYTKVLTNDPADLTALYNLGYAYKGLGSPAKAAECFERLLRARPDYMEARLVLSECYVSLGRVPAALALLRQRTADGATDAGYQNHLGTVLASAGRLDEAAAALERAIALRPSEPSAYLNLARVQLVRRDRAGAVETLRRAVAAAPGDPRAAARLDEIAKGSP